ncbi:MAG TPA: SAM-dependent methyltransferase [Bacteroidia bacterium]|nr:SAM-dependent methyltransferase [Bacteroidia bacterium]
MNTKGTLYLIPTTLGVEAEISESLPSHIEKIINEIDDYIVENEKSARHFLKKMGIKKSLNDISLYVLNTQSTPEIFSSYLNAIESGKNMGIISEAGCPCIADPGAVMVKLAHQKKIKVVPLTGPSSILLALMASGFNGQNFTFHGYLPKEKNDRVRKIKELEKNIFQKQQTQIFIETPYRNQHLLEDILASCASNTLLCVACDITLPSEMIITQRIAEWQKKLPDIHKRPTIFLLYN